MTSILGTNVGVTGGCYGSIASNYYVGGGAGAGTGVTTGGISGQGGSGGGGLGGTGTAATGTGAA